VSGEGQSGDIQVALFFHLNNERIPMEARWDLLPIPVLARISNALELILDDKIFEQFKFDKNHPKRGNLINEFMSLIMDWKLGNRFHKNTHYENLAFAAAQLFIAADEKNDSTILEEKGRPDIVRWDLIPMACLEQIAILSGIYRNEANGKKISTETGFADCMSHFKDFVMGNEYDTKTGIRNIYISILYIMMLMENDDHMYDGPTVLSDMHGRPPIKIPSEILQSAKKLSRLHAPIIVKPKEVKNKKAKKP